MTTVSGRCEDALVAKQHHYPASLIGQFGRRPRNGNKKARKQVVWMARRNSPEPVEIPAEDGGWSNQHRNIYDFVEPLKFSKSVDAMWNHAEQRLGELTSTLRQGNKLDTRLQYGALVTEPPWLRWKVVGLLGNLRVTSGLPAPPSPSESGKELADPPTSREVDRDPSQHRDADADHATAQPDPVAHLRNLLQSGERDT